MTKKAIDATAALARAVTAAEEGKNLVAERWFNRALQLESASATSQDTKGTKGN